MKFSDFTDALKRAKPGELKELRDVLVSAPAAPEREVMEPDERRALGAELVERYARYQSGRERLDVAVASAEVKLVEARRAHEAACSDAYGWRGGDEYASFRDQAALRLWGGRPALVDSLIANVREEAKSLRWDSFTVPADDPRLRSGGMETGPEELARYHDKTFTNQASVDARSVGLRDLAERLEAWTRKGEYSTEAELTAIFAAAYKKLPPVESMDAVLRRAGGRYAAFADRFPRRPQAAPPPAA